MDQELLPGTANTFAVAIKKLGQKKRISVMKKGYERVLVIPSGLISLNVDSLNEESSKGDLFYGNRSDTCAVDSVLNHRRLGRR
ncbi:hypothetical protein ACIPF8_19940 [Collimonas sp. NPDC087041]|uniref:hypothetical protein n=1 Tax=Collimonas sp. NPDC087041 TaxID=3363960 RepID=UPI0038079374